MTTLADLIGKLREDAVRVARERKSKTRPPHHNVIGKSRYSGLPEHHLADIGGKSHAPLLYEERTHPD